MHYGVLHRSFLVCHVGHCDFTDKIVVNINLLDTMPAGFICFVNYDFLYKRIEQFGEQLVRYRRGDFGIKARNADFAYDTNPSLSSCFVCSSPLTAR